MPTVNTVVLTQQSRQGTFVSNPVTVPSNVIGIRIYANIALADKLSVGLTMSLNVERSEDSGATWLDLAGFGWTSYGPAGYPAGKDGIVNPDPSISFSPTPFLGQLFRVTTVIPQPLTVGATVALTT